MNSDPWLIPFVRRIEKHPGHFHYWSIIPLILEKVRVEQLEHLPILDRIPYPYHITKIFKPQNLPNFLLISPLWIIHQSK